MGRSGGNRKTCFGGAVGFRMMDVCKHPHAAYVAEGKVLGRWAELGREDYSGGELVTKQFSRGECNENFFKPM